jgi:hypothetical protein
MTEHIGKERWTIALFACATVAAIVAPVAARAHVALGVASALSCLFASPWVALALPAALEGVFRRRRIVSSLWVLLAIVAVLQMGRLSAFMADASREWGSVVPDPSATHHQCLSAYVYAADLNRRGVPNLYDAGWYPMFDPPSPTCRLVVTPVAGLAPWIADPYEYPPPFLLLPRAALALTRSFDTIRAWWFLVHGLAFVVAGLLLARWVGGREGVVIGLLVPAVLASFETMFDLQFGQFHAVAVMLALGAMVAFEGRRPSLGGGLLAAAILSKLFPAVMLVVLATRRDWRALAWTAAWGAGFVALGLVVLGPEPFTAFAHYQLPRIASGAAFHFTHEGRNAGFLLSRNASIAALADKLRLLGAPAAALALAHATSWLYTLALIPLAVLAARGGRTRVGRTLVWLALLNLAALRAPLAPSFYVLAPVLWVLVLLATQVNGRAWLVFALVVAWQLVLGPPPLPERADLIVGLLCQAAAVAVNVAVFFWTRPPAPTHSGWHRSVRGIPHREPSRPEAGASRAPAVRPGSLQAPGRMFWFTRNRFSGSYFALRRASRS